MLNREELKRAAERGLPVLYEDRVRGFKTTGQITAIIDRYENGERALRVEVKEINKNSVIICVPEALSLWNGSTDNSSERRTLHNA